MSILLQYLYNIIQFIERNPSVVVIFGGIAGCLILLNKWLSGGKCHSLARLDGKTVIITGANTGIGKETALDLSRRGTRIILACRDTKRGEEAAKDIRFKTGNPDVLFKKLDLASFQSIRAFAEDVLKSEPKIQILINNADFLLMNRDVNDGLLTVEGINGTQQPLLDYVRLISNLVNTNKTGSTGIIFLKKDAIPSLFNVPNTSNKLDSLRKRLETASLPLSQGVAVVPKSKTEDGYEMHFGVNHLGHFLLTLLLLDRIKESTPSRIINVSSLVYKVGKIHFENINMEKKYNPFHGYWQSKLANILFTRELAKRVEGTGVTTYCLHPGAVHTELDRYSGKSVSEIFRIGWHMFSRVFFKSPKQGAQTTIYCAVEEEIANESGHYYSDCHRTELLPHARDEAVAKKLWEISENFTGITL